MKSGFKNFMNKHPVLFSCSLVVIAVALCMGIFVATDNLADVSLLNPDNLIKVGEAKDGGNIKLVSKNQSNGLKIDVDEKTGAVKISGDTKKAADPDSLLYASVELQAGTYCLTSGYKNTSVSSVYMTAEAGGQELCKADMADEGPDGVFTLTEAAVVDIYIHVANAEYDSAVTLRPVLVPGEEKGSFFNT